MATKRSSTLTPDDILSGQPPDITALANRLRAIIRTTVPEAREAAYPGWKAIGYRHPETGYFCGIFPLGDHIKLYFEYGRFLPDPEGLLAGETKQTRYLIVRTAKDIKTRALKKLLQAAVVIRKP